MSPKLKTILEYIVPNPLWQRIKYRTFIKSGVFIDPYVDIQGSRLGKNVGLVSYSQVVNSVIGDYSYVGKNSMVTEAELGKFCSISWNVTIGATNHPYRIVTTHSFPYDPGHRFVDENGLVVKRVHIGHDVWIGCNGVIMPGVKIGHGAVIGAGAVVTGDVPPYAVAVGVPAATVKYRFAEETIERLLQLEWWNLPLQVIKENVNLFQKEVDGEILDELDRLKM